VEEENPKHLAHEGLGGHDEEGLPTAPGQHREPENQEVILRFRHEPSMKNI
jgi:hypothetical protein